jgi:uncharacterized membrane protein
MAKRAAPMRTSAKDDKPTQMIVDDRRLAFAVYLLYLVGYFTGITALIGVIIAGLQVGSANAAIKSHYTFQIRTFWIGLLYLVIGLLLLHLVVGMLVLLWWLLWSLVRNIKGLLALNRNESIAQRESWMFGD